MNMNMSKIIKWGIPIVIIIIVIAVSVYFAMSDSSTTSVDPTPTVTPTVTPTATVTQTPTPTGTKQVVTQTPTPTGTQQVVTGTTPIGTTPVGAPITTVPMTTVPMTTVPMTTVPMTTVPMTTVPMTTVPMTTVPMTTVPIPPSMSKSFSLAGATYIAFPNTDHANVIAGNTDIINSNGNSIIITSSLSDCQARCDAISNCVGFVSNMPDPNTNNIGGCWLKSSLNVGTANGDRYTMKKSPAYIALNNGHYNKDYVDNNIGNNLALVGTPIDCANQCNSTVGCAGFVTNGADNISSCQLKSSMVLAESENSQGVYTYGWKKQ